MFAFPVFVVEMVIEGNPRGKRALSRQAECSVPSSSALGSEGICNRPRFKEDWAERHKCWLSGGPLKGEPGIYYQPLQN